jgi:hypothetical protein
VPTIRAASASVNSVAVGSAGDELQIAVAPARLTTGTAMIIRITPLRLLVPVPRRRYLSPGAGDSQGCAWPPFVAASSASGPRR